MSGSTPEGAIAALLAALPTEFLSRIATFIDGIRECAICPALVWLIGPASSGQDGLSCFTGPIVVPLAHYGEYIMRQADGATADA